MIRHGISSARRRAGIACACIGLFSISLLSAGCGGAPQQAPVGEQHLKHFPSLYMRYCNDNNGNPPKNEGEFKAYLKKIKPEEIKNMGIANVDEIFISPRDKQPYVIVWGMNPRMGMVRPTGGGPSGPPGGAAGPGRPPGAAPNTAMAGPAILAYEKVGEGGKRFAVMMMGGSVKEYTDEELKGYGVKLQYFPKFFDCIWLRAC